MNAKIYAARTLPFGFGASLAHGATLYVRGTSQGRRRHFIRITNDGAVGKDLRIKSIARPDLPEGLVAATTGADVASRCFGQASWDAYTDGDLLLENQSFATYNIYVFEQFYYESD